MDWIEGVHLVIQALLATVFTWSITALGAGSVFFTRTVSRRRLDIMLGFAAGVMVAASFWSLLAPSIELAEEYSSLPAWFLAVVGFLLGGVFLRGIDFMLPHLHLNLPVEQAEGLHATWQRSILLVVAITLHNIPEGLAIGAAAGDIVLTLRSYQTTDNPAYEWIAPVGDNSCASCKPGVTQTWLDNDAHAQSSTNMRFLTMYNGTNVNGNQSPLTRCGPISCSPTTAQATNSTFRPLPATARRATRLPALSTLTRSPATGMARSPSRRD